MWQEGQEEEEDDQEEDLFDDLSKSFVLCALHQAKIIRERWKFWSGKVPADVSIRLHRLESLLLMNEESRQRKSMIEHDPPSLDNPPIEIPLQQISSNINSSQPFLAEIRNYSSIDEYLTERIEPKHNIIIQGPDIRRIIQEKRRFHFWCCH